MPSLGNAVVCQCANAGLLDPCEVRDASARLQQEGFQVHTVADLCALAAGRDPLLARLTAEDSLTVMACYPRAVKWLFEAAGAPLRANARLVNLRKEPPVNTLTATGSAASNEAASSPEPTGLTDGATGGSAARDGWIPWFPVIDFDRCTHCLECLSFCLFGVYGVGADGRVAMRAPENCKANCPACARVCPELAIMFPKHKAAPINGDVVSDAARREAVKVNISALLGGDVYARLRSRGQARFSGNRDQEQGLRERQRFLARLVETGDVPPELLVSLGKMPAQRKD